MTSIPKPYDGTEYVSHTVTAIPLRRSPTKRWEVDVVTTVPEGMADLPFKGFFDIPVTSTGAQTARAIDKFAEGMRKRWNKRTNTSDAWIDDLKADLKKAVDEG